MPIQTQELVVAIVLGAVISTLFIAFIITLFFLYQKRQNAFKKEIASMEINYQQQKIKVQYEMQEAILSSISEKLHHEVKNNIDLITIKIRDLAYKISLKKLSLEEVMEKLEQTAELNDDIKQQVRLTSHSLMPDRIKQVGLLEAIEYEVNRIQKSVQLVLEFKVEGERYFALSEKESIFIFRLFQESMSNVLQHANATFVNIIITKSDNHKFILKVIDNGVGFNVFERSKAKLVGIGLMALQQRAAQINATYDIKSSKGEGTVVELLLPSNT